MAYVMDRDLNLENVTTKDDYIKNKNFEVLEKSNIDDVVKKYTSSLNSKVGSKVNLHTQESDKQKDN